MNNSNYPSREDSNNLNNKMKKLRYIIISLAIIVLLLIVFAIVLWCNFNNFKSTAKNNSNQSQTVSPSAKKKTTLKKAAGANSNGTNKSKAQQKAISESIDNRLKEMEEQIKIYNEESKKIIDKYSLDICGKYVNTYNELSKTDGGQADLNATESVTEVMLVNDDNTIDFADGKIGWWSLYENEEGIVHMGYGIEGAQNMGMFMVCDGNLIDVTSSAVLFGKLPAEDTFDGTFTDGSLTFMFKQDGTLEAEYNETITEDGTTFPYTEVYRGEYHRDGIYMDILLNGSTSRYITFNAKTNDPEKPVSGIAAKYFVKTDM